MPSAIAPLISKTAQPMPADQFRVAAFYSISNCQPGLKGVSLGNFLIKRVAEELKRELPQLRSFVTLSPIPGFARWLRTGAVCEGLPKARQERLDEARQQLQEAVGSDLDKIATVSGLKALSAEGTEALTRLCAFYLGFHSPAAGGDPVARFHLDNGARLERLNPLGDLSAKGVKQSFGMMVNYLYDLTRVEAHHEKFTQGEVAHSRALASLL
jgi:malonyl-CoA decarboxylase